jgi:S-adenosylmethionine decarboxylase
VSIHIIADLTDCKESSLYWNPNLILEITKIVDSASTVLDTKWKKFDNNAYTGVMLLAESHFAIHTWPENNTCCFDLFTCGDINPIAAARKIEYLLKGKNDTSFTTIVRSYNKYNNKTAFN